MAKTKTASRSTALAIKHALARGRHAAMVKPIVIRTPTPVVKVTKSKKKHHHHHGGHMSIGGIFSPKRTALMVGSFALGVLEKQNVLQQLPALPLIGRTGTIGVAAHMISGGRAGLADDISTAAFIIAAHELGQTGSVVGGYVAGEDDPSADWERQGGVDYVNGY